MVPRASLSGGCHERPVSNDKGRTWTIWEGNPIIRHVGRDPKLFWCEQGRHWSIAVYDEDSSGRGIAFYKSTDLKNWVHSRTARTDCKNFLNCIYFS